MADRFELETFLPYRLNRAAEAVSLSFSRIYKSRYDMTRPEWRTLAALGAIGRMTATAIGAHSSMHKTKVSRAISALEKRRWIRRTEDTGDRRIEHIELTPLGRKAYEDLAGHARAYQAEITAILGHKGLKSLEDGLDAVESAITGRKLPG
jgi:DNA-binding MarR family transcriptional regulator